MSRKFQYRFRSPIGGLAADLTAEVKECDEEVRPSVVIGRGVALRFPSDGLYWKDASWLAFGVHMHLGDLMDLRPQGLVVSIDRLEMPLSDYRSEVAALAMDGWLRGEFGFPASGAMVKYDSSTREYVFKWGDIAEPFADAFPHS